MKLTPEMLQKVKDVVNKHHAAFAVGIFGEGVLPDEVVAELEAEGLLEDVTDTTEIAYLYGQLTAKLQDPALINMALDDVLKELEKNPIPLSPAEKDAIETAKLSAATYITGLSEHILKDVGGMLQTSAQEYRAKVRQGVSENIANRETTKQLKSSLGHATLDWTRNLDRVAITEKHNAMQEGVADGIRKRYSDDARVFLRPMPDACKHCKRLHLGPDGVPRIFLLSQLAPPGANVGKKPQDWVPTIGAVHPHCQCQLHYIPVGWGFDAQGTLTPDGEYGVEWDGGDFGKALLREDEHLESLAKAYKLEGELNFQGLDIAIETGAGGLRFWKDHKAGEAGATAMQWPYGYIRGTLGVDGDHVDCYVGPNPDAPKAYVVHQRKKYPDGTFRGYDEDKIMLGFSSLQEARDAYLAHYDDPGFLDSITTMAMEELKEKLPKTKDKPQKLTKADAFTVPNPDYAEPPPRRLEPDHRFVVKAGPYIGPRGGKYADPQHKIPWKPIEVSVLLKESLGIRRVDMPQVASADVGRFLADLAARGIKAKRKAIPVSKLKATQSELHAEKVLAQASRPVADIAEKPVLTSRDGYILDGHHRWAGLRYLSGGHKINAIEVDLDIQALLQEAHAFEGVSYKKSLEKAGPYKYTTKKKGKGGKWIYTYAQEHGGKVRPHKTDPDQVTIKLPKDKAPILQELAKKHGLGEVVVGDKYAMAFVKVTASGQGSQAATKPAPKPPQKSPSKPAGPFDAAALTSQLSDLTGHSPEAIQKALTSSAGPGSQAAKVRGDLERAVLTHGLQKQDAILDILGHGGHSAAETKKTLSGIVKGDLERAVSEYEHIPSYDLELLSKVTLAGKPITGYAQCNMASRSLKMGHRPKTGDYATGDFRHELGHAVHGHFIGDKTLDAVVSKGYADSKKRAKAKPPTTSGKMDSNWYEEEWGVTGKRGMDDAKEYMAEHYRCYHRAIHQERTAKPNPKGSATLAEYRSRHPEMARLMDARYTVALLGLEAKGGAA